MLQQSKAEELLQRNLEEDRMIPKDGDQRATEETLGENPVTDKAEQRAGADEIEQTKAKSDGTERTNTADDSTVQRLSQQSNTALRRKKDKETNCFGHEAVGKTVAATHDPQLLAL